MRELPQPYRGGIAIARNAEVQQVAVGQIGAGQHRRHPTMHRVEAVRSAQEVIGRLGAAADTRQLGDPMRQNVQFPASLDDGRRDGVMAAARAERRHLAFVVASGVADLVRLQGRVMQSGLGEVGHVGCNSFLRSAAPACTRSLMAWVMNRAVIGVPS